MSYKVFTKTEFPLTPQDMATGPLNALRLFWPRVRDNPKQAPRQACKILAAWGNLKRFPPESLPADKVAKFNRFVKSEIDALATAFMELDFIDGWVEAIKKLDYAYKHCSDEDRDECDIMAGYLLDELDNYSLADYAIDVISNPWRFNHEKTSKAVNVAEGFFYEFDHNFSRVSEYSQAMYDSFRDDADECSVKLHRTVLYHFRVSWL